MKIDFLSREYQSHLVICPLVVTMVSGAILLASLIWSLDLLTCSSPMYMCKRHLMIVHVNRCDKKLSSKNYPCITINNAPPPNNNTFGAKTDISPIGCSSHHINKLFSNISRTLWISLVIREVSGCLSEVTWAINLLYTCGSHLSHITGFCKISIDRYKAFDGSQLCEDSHCQNRQWSRQSLCGKV